MNKVLICKNCESNDMDILMPTLKGKENVLIETRCNNTCAIGQEKPCAIVNGELVIGDDSNDLLNKILSKIV